MSSTIEKKVRAGFSFIAFFWWAKHARLWMGADGKMPL
jgi:hypothetical protein